MHRVLLLGAGKIGRTIAHFLANCGDYEVVVADQDPESLDRLHRGPHLETLALDATSRVELDAALRSQDSVVSALSYRFNPLVAQAALATGVSYFDLTEDIETAHRIKQFGDNARPGQIFMPQCGLAPGFISIAAYYLTRSFERLDTVRMRVGALPQFPSNAMKYNLTWSTDGLINEYCNLCEAIYDGKLINVLPLEGLEHFSIDGIHYEAFNTSGGLGTLCATLEARVRDLNYKTVRYLGHRDLMAFLVNELRLSQRRDILKDILENAIPITLQDVVVSFCTVTGWQKGQLVQVSDARKIYQQTIGDETYSAIQITTATALCAVLDLHVAGRLPEMGFVKQENVDFDEFLHNRFGRYYDSHLSSRWPHHQGEMTGAAHV